MEDLCYAFSLSTDAFYSILDLHYTSELTVAINVNSQFSLPEIRDSESFLINFIYNIALLQFQTRAEGFKKSHDLSNQLPVN